MSTVAQLEESDQTLIDSQTEGSIARVHASHDADDQVARGVGIVGLASVALIHLVDSSGKLAEIPYVFWLYMALIAGTMGAAALLLRRDSRLAWAGAAAMAAATIVAYVLSRTTGLPGASDDIGNWSEPLGMASVFVESGVLLLAIYKLWTLAAFRDHGS
jgi:hypothetical protein